MKRIAAPMVGGLVTSAFLTLEIIPAIVTYWRYDQLLWQRLAAVDPDRLTALRRLTGVIGAGAAMILAVPVARLYVALPGAWQVVMLAVGIAALTGGIVSYLVLRPGAQRLVWPERA
jgi:Cu(I)/Ag(I) efflux system membrane protein CusA/SilA